MIQTRVTTIEAYRRAVATEWGTESELIDMVKGSFKPNAHMEAGTAFHAILAEPNSYLTTDGGEDVWFESKGYTFNVSQMEGSIKHVGDGFCEVPGSRVFDTLHGHVKVNGTCDRISGKTIRDAKATFTTPSAANYEQSMQWRLYLLLFEADCFVYDLFAFSEPKDGFCNLRDIVSFKLYRYPSLEDDCNRWVRSFVDWADSRGLMRYLDPPCLLSKEAQQA